MGGYKKIKKIFITYPRTALDKKDFGSFLIEITNPKEVMVCQETHSEPGVVPTHLHAYLDLDVPMAKEVILKKLKERYGEYETNRIKVEGARSGGASKNYMNKEDEDPYIWSRAVGQRKLTTREVYRAQQMRLGVNYPLEDYMTESELNMPFEEYREYKERQEREEQEWLSRVREAEEIRQTTYKIWKSECMFYDNNGHLNFTMGFHEFRNLHSLLYPDIPRRDGGGLEN